MITDEQLLLYHYRELDADERARVGQALGEQPELAQRLHRLVMRLDAAAAQPEVAVPADVQQRWHAALDAAAASQRMAPASRRPARPVRWQAFAAAATLAAVAFVGVFQWRSTPTVQVADVPAEVSAYEHGLKRHLASTERQLVGLSAASPEERARLIDAIIGQNRIYALAAERAGEPQLARVLRAFTPILEDVAAGRAASSEGSIAQLGFEMRVMQARLDAGAPSSNNL